MALPRALHETRGTAGRPPGSLVVMPTIELTCLCDVASRAEVDALPAAMTAHVADEADREQLAAVGAIALEEFLERLEDDAAEVYLPAAKARVVLVGRRRFGSARSLLERLEALRPDLELDLPKDERAPALAQQRSIWRGLHAAARESLRTGQVITLEGVE